MTFGEWFKNKLDPVTKIVIWTQDNREENGPDWEGWLLDMPWFYMDYELDMEGEEEPIHLSLANNEVILVVNLIAK